MRRMKRLTGAALVLALTVALMLGWMPAASAIGLQQFLPVYRFYNQSNGSHFYTASEVERAAVSANYPDLYTFEGIAYMVWQESMIAPDGVVPVEDPGLVPLHRFYNKLNGSHFYTISEVEKAAVIANYPGLYVYEGVAYEVFEDSGYGNLAAVHRFYNKLNGSHFYTISETEAALVRLKFADIYRYEGIAFYAYSGMYFN